MPTYYSNDSEKDVSGWWYTGPYSQPSQLRIITPCRLSNSSLKDKDIPQTVSEDHNRQKTTRSQSALWESSSKPAPDAGSILGLTMSWTGLYIKYSNCTVSKSILSNQSKGHKLVDGFIDIRNVCWSHVPWLSGHCSVAGFRMVECVLANSLRVPFSDLWKRLRK